MAPIPENLVIAKLYDGQHSELTGRKRLVLDGDNYKSDKAGHFAKLIRTELKPVKSLLDVHDALAPIAAGEADATVIYGQLNKHGRKAHTLGAHFTRSRHTFEDAPQHVHWIDIDEAIFPPPYSHDMPLGEVERLLRPALPPELKNGTWLLAATGSHGCIISGRLDVPRLRIVIWSEKPITIAEMKSYVVQRLEPHIAKTLAPIKDRCADPSLYSIAHYIFVAPPTWDDGPGPYSGDRLHFAKGRRNAVKLPKLEPLAEPVKRAAVKGERKQTNGQRQPNIFAGQTDADIIAAIRPGSSHGETQELIRRAVRRHGRNPAGMWSHIAHQLEPALDAQIKATSDTDAEYIRRRRQELGPVLRQSAERYYNIWLSRQPKIEIKATDKAEANCEKPPQPSENKPAKKADTIADFRERLRATAATAMREAVKADHEAPVCHIFAHGPGSAKTGVTLAAAVDAVLGHDKAFIVFAAANRAQAREVYRRARRESLRTLIREYGSTARAAITETRAKIMLKLGRSAHCVKKDDYEGQAAAELEKAGMSPVKTVCDVCGGCDWPNVHKRWRVPGKATKDDRARLVIMTHADLVTTMRAYEAGSKSGPDVIVIDENIFGTLAGDERPQPVQRLKAAPIMSKPESEADLRALRFNVIGLLTDGAGIVSAADCAPMLNQIRQLRQAEGAFRNERFGQIEKAVDAHADITRIAHQVSHVRISQTFSDIAAAIDASMQIEGRADIYGLRSFITPADAAYFVCATRKQLPAGPSYIILDGSIREPGDVDFIFGAGREALQFRYHKADPPAGNYRLTQIADRFFSKSMLTGEERINGNSNIAILHNKLIALAWGWRRERLAGRRRHSCVISGRPIDVLLVCQKDVKEALAPLCFPKNVHVLTLGQVRGDDRFRDVPCAIVVGRIATDTRVTERGAMTMHFDDDRAINIAMCAEGVWPTTTRQLKMKDARTTAHITGEYHPDARCEVIRRVTGDDEVTQAIHRVRLADRTPDNYADIHVLGTTDTGLPADVITTWSDCRLSIGELMRQSGIVFKRAQTAADAYLRGKTNPDVHEGLRSACKLQWEVVENGDQFPTTPKGIYINGEVGNWSDDFRIAEFRRVHATKDGRKSYKEKVAIVNGFSHYAVELIEELLCEAIADFKWLDEQPEQPGRSGKAVAHVTRNGSKAVVDAEQHRRS